MKIGTITPTLGRRPKLLERSKFYMDRQTLRVDQRIVVSYPQTRFPHDLTDRYRLGVELLKEKTDVIFFIEDDDYYPADYIETILRAFESAGSPEIFGIGETYFYHPELDAAWYRRHSENEGPAAFQMLLRSDALQKIDWSLVGELFTDAGLWRQLTGKTVTFPGPLSVGIKHGRGICGAGGHNLWFYQDMVRKTGGAPSQQLISRPPEWAVINQPNGFDWLGHLIKNKEDADWYRAFGRDKDIV